MSQLTTKLPSEEKYPTVLRALHWATALIFLLLFVSGYTMVDLDKQDTFRPTLFGWHKSLGVLTILLLAARLRVRLRSTMPNLPAALQEWEKQLAHGGHKALYLFMIITPLTGWATSDLHGKAVKLFGLPLPKLFPTVEDIGTWPGDVHTVLAYSALALISLHVAAVIKHRFLDRHDVLQRMW
ncbi:MAG: cytochrome b [Methylococcaceae bacterium]|nr:cytochrome b [Methylococcaceae bacterium]